MRQTPPRAFICSCAGPRLSEEEKEFFRRHGPWGLILFARNVRDPDQVRHLVAEFREAVDRPTAPVFIDQEGGRVQRLRPPHWRDWPAARRFAELFAADPPVALRAARLVTWAMGRELAALGVDADCLPVLDVPQPGSHEIIGDRAYGEDPVIVAILARAALAGLQEAGIAGVVKHVPGHGRATADSHRDLPVVAAPREELARVDFLPFAALADADMAMTAHVVYAAIDAARPATLSPVVIGEIIRGEIGFDGLLMSDDLNMEALSGSLAERAQGALAAGCDVVLHCSGDLGEMREVAAVSPPLSGMSLDRARRAEARQAARAALAAAMDAETSRQRERMAEALLARLSQTAA